MSTCGRRPFSCGTSTLTRGSGFKVQLFHLLVQRVCHLVDLVCGLFELSHSLGDDLPFFVQLGHMVTLIRAGSFLVLWTSVFQGDLEHLV